MKKIFLLNFLIMSLIYGEKHQSIKSEEVILDKANWKYEKTHKTTLLKTDAKIIVPLEIITDLEIDATVVDNQKLEVPFTLEMNKNPNKKYKINYSEKIIDIDGDRRNDIEIISPEYAHTKIVENNKLIIYGENIKNDGIYHKRVYISVQLIDGGKR